MSSSVIHSTWLLHFRLYINDQKVTWLGLHLHLAAGKSCKVTLEYEHSPFIGTDEGALALHLESGAEVPGITCEPLFEQLVEMTKGTISKTWLISTSQANSSEFKLYFTMPRYDVMPKSPEINVSIINFAQEVEVKFDKFPLLLGPSKHAYPCRGAKHTVTVTPLLPSQLLNKKVKLLWSGSSAANLGIRVEPAVAREQLLTQEGVTWEVDCVTAILDGWFALQLVIVELGAESLPLSFSLGDNLLGAYAWTEKPAADRWEDHCTVFSKFSRLPVSGVIVKVTQHGSVGDMVTDSQGLCKVGYYPSWDPNISFKLENPYDGSLVNTSAP
ncbi:hypothetical protein [Pseudomonas sp. LB3P14]